MNHLFLLRKAPWPKFWEGVSVVTTGVFLLLSGPAVADESLAVKTLKEQAKFWETKGRYDLAAPAWTRLLQIDPKNSEAIAGLAQYELTNNRPEAAQAMVEVLKKQPEVNAAVIKRIENLALQQSLNPRQLDQAREAARAGKPEEAVSLYRQLLGGRAPPRSLAVEYLQTLGGTSSGWEEARNGFERLRVEDPSSLEVQLAYAQHLTYRAATRREGIRLLSQLSRTSQVGSSALDAWKRALTWLDASPSDTPLYQSYLKLQPNDSVIKERVASLNQAAVPRLTDPRSSALRDGYAALDAGDVADAEKRFEGLLVQAPKNSDALGGLGVVRLKQKRFAEAENLLAAAARTGGAAKWAESLNTSRFWRAMEEGQVRQDEQHFDLANEAFSRAQKLDPSALEPKIARFWVLERLGRFDEAKNVLSTIKDSTQQREANQLLIKRKVRNAMEAKDYVEVERLLSDSTAQVDVETLELLAWARYHQGNFVLAVSGFAEAYKRSTTKDAAAGLVYSSHKLKEYQQILEILKNDAGPLRELVSLSVQQKMTQGENRFELDSNGRLHELDPVSLLNDDVLWPATLAFEREKNYKKAYDLLLPYEDKLVQIGDYTALATLAQAAALVGDKETELRAFQKAAEGSEEEVFFSFWSQALKKYGRYSEAEAVLLKIAKNLDAPNLISLGWVQYELKKYEQAALRFAESYAKEPTEFAASGLVHSAHKANKLSVILPALEKHPGGPLDLLVPADIRSQIASNENKFWVDARGQVAVVRGGDNSEREGLVLKFEPHLRGKSGEAGGGRLRQSGLVVTLSWQGEAYRASLEVEQQHATDAIDRVRGQRWYAKWGMKISPSLDLQMGVGRTLNGGVVQSAAIGEFGMSYLFSAGNVGGRVFKRGSEESLLALSGTPDIASGLNWGRSLESGIVLNANHKGEIFEKLASLTLSRIESGQNVADNRKVEFYGLALHGLEAVAGLSVGPELYYSRFRQNLSSFELGHGGYFSPRDSVTFGGYARYETSLGSMALTFTGGLGLGYSRVDATASNPITGSIPGFYPASTARGIAYHGRMQGLQPLSPNWDLGFGLGFQRSPSFSDWRANVFVKRNWSK